MNYLQHFNQGLFYNLDHWYVFSRYAKEISNPELRAQRDYIYDSRLTYTSTKGGQSGLRTKPFVQCGMETIGIFATAINEMLLQSHEGKIKVFPAIPSNFSAAFRLCAEGAFNVSSAIDSSGVISFVEIESQAGKECRIQNPWRNDVTVVTKDNQQVNVQINDIGVISFKTRKGETYIITEKNSPLSDFPMKAYCAERNRSPKKLGEATLGKECTFIKIKK